MVGAQEHLVVVLWSSSGCVVGVDGRPLHHVFPAQDGHQREAFVQHKHRKLWRKNVAGCVCVCRVFVSQAQGNSSQGTNHLPLPSHASWVETTGKVT